ncbi:DNA mismatch repair endonuclease MutL [Dyadobacter sediminis]|uniref:DNA mismatch repair protein MutL n=1 Tax=Dyadobacter sediminis TaxID=1493691 RepID=A0A5R9K695_9BACT|nr:DNA mismatch repair endonuclease MutL [Dyadobacter sediminis]TLU89173.1 DNA mismatch repair endonuclease MutL [Dyadobacter sediminis]GGC02197.1 DNA mismatch repair protein MutL [Dyadobacter sediminis]
MPSSDIIQLLPDSIANQIAAGEVVQRPASVVKELLENAIDAKANYIQVILREAGRTLIQIIDDGTGMSEMDARMCFERHATSKIRQSEDLFRIRTMGFRGEALASIAAVAQVELRTRQESDELGTLIRIEGSEIKTQEAVACLKGTSILVRNLFFNVPARRNFLKSNSVEMRHVLDEFQRVALAHPQVGFSLHHNDTEVFNLMPGKLVRRIVDIYGKSYREQLAFCQEDTSYISVRGYIGKPEFSRKTRGEQFFFVNDRYIKHSYMHHAVISAFDGTIPEGSHPFYVLFIEIDPSHIDINIHPTKTEIKFDDERSVYAIVMAAVKKAVGIYNLSQSIDFEGNTNFLNTSPSDQNNNLIPRTVMPDWVAQSKRDENNQSRSNLTNWNKLFEGLQNPDDRNRELAAFELNTPTASRPSYQEESKTVASKVNRMALEAISAPESDAMLFQLHNRFILSQVKDGIMLIDQKAAYERILYERYRKMLTNRNGACQQLLFPKTIRLTHSDMQLVHETKKEIRSLGFEFDEFGSNELIIRGIPADLPEESEQDLFEELIEQLKQSYSDLKLNKPESLSRSLAKRFSIRYAVKLSLVEIHTLINQLFASTDPNRTPTGEAIIVLLTMDKLTSIFKG